jgi:hypothetical protein
MTIFTPNLEAVRYNICNRDVKAVDYVFNWKGLFYKSLPLWGYNIEI